MPNDLTPEQLEMCVAIEAFLGDDLKARDEDAFHLIAHGFSCNVRYEKGKSYVIVHACNDLEIVLDRYYLQAIDAARYVWNNRHNQPWQAALEQHIAAYRRQPRDWFDHNLIQRELLPAIEMAGLLDEYQMAMREAIEARNPTGPINYWMEFHRATPAQIVAAACSVIPNPKESEI